MRPLWNAPAPDHSALTKAFDEGKAAFVAKQFEKSLKKAAEIDPKQAGV
jgi:hypothetical protein